MYIPNAAWAILKFVVVYLNFKYNWNPVILFAKSGNPRLRADDLTSLSLNCPTCLRKITQVKASRAVWHKANLQWVEVTFSFLPSQNLVSVKSFFFL